jgi:hypothetical protein
MLLLLALLQIAATEPATRPPPPPPLFLAADPDSLYASEALRALVARAVARNRLIPEGLESYRARIESEVGIVSRRPDGAEGTFSVEQVNSDVRWRLPGSYEQRVTGYRQQALGVNVSMLGFFRQAWTVPMLYGNRLSLFFGRDSARTSRMQRRGPITAVHPFAEDRERVYRFSGGDTVQVLRTGERAQPIARVLVEPRGVPVDTPTTVFSGEVDVDVSRHEIVRMRGHFLTLGRAQRGRILGMRVIEAIAYVELENAEYEGRFWLPSYQRFEAQVAMPSVGDARSVFRILSRYRGMRVNDTTGLAMAMASAGGDSLDVRALQLMPHRLTWAPRDSIERFSGWSSDIGTATASVHADDFDDVAPDSWRPTGEPLFRARVSRLSDAAHFNRIEGFYTGYGAELRLRDAAPGVVVRGHAGWAWREQTVRGMLNAEWARGRWTPHLRAGRSLDLTNDFRAPFDSGVSFAALLWNVDDYDYVDRRVVALGATVQLRGRRSARLRVEAGPASDHYAAANVAKPPLRFEDSPFRANRGVDEGRYLRTAAVLDLNPDTRAEFMRPGFGAQLSYERGDGTLDYQRVELMLGARRNRGRFTLAARLDAGALFADTPPPQQLFEIGETQNLPGYDYKEFAGDRAVVARGMAMYGLGVFRSPIRLGARWLIPAPAPAFSVGLQSGWTEASDAAADASILRLGRLDDPLGGPPGSGSGPPASRVTDGIRSSIDLRLRFFGGAVSVGLARPIDHGAGWRIVWGLAQQL